MEKSSYTTEHDSTDSSESTGSNNGSRRRVGGLSLSALEGQSKAEAPKSSEDERPPVLLFSREMFSRVVDEEDSSKKPESDDEDEEGEEGKDSPARPIIPKPRKSQDGESHTSPAAEYIPLSPEGNLDTASSDDATTAGSSRTSASMGFPPPPGTTQGGGAGGNVVPQPPDIGGFNAMPSPNNPYHYGGFPNNAPNASMANYGVNLAPPTPDTATLESQAQARGHQHGMRKGFLLGAVGGNWWRGRRAKREMTAANDNAREEAARQQPAANAREYSYQEQVKKLTNYNTELQRQANNAEFRAREATARGFETPAAVAIAGVAARRAEAIRLQAVKTAEQPPSGQNLEQAAENQAAEKATETPDRYVQSEWLRIGLTKEGKVDGNQTFGESFQRELNQEQAGSRFKDDGKKRRAADDAGTEDVQMLGQFGLQAGGVVPATGQANLNNRLDDGQADLGHRLAGPKSQIVSNLTNPWFWLMLILLVGVFFAASLLG